MLIELSMVTIYIISMYNSNSVGPTSRVQYDVHSFITSYSTYDQMKIEAFLRVKHKEALLKYKDFFSVSQ